ncbi:MAG: hypothetical protein A2Y24_07920 [Clostridiales bacterium GWE2_32_10]|nr:MAG: hypothetical protein A2Y24_07920 [Clostridiales bacterium GWE2_32_10]
MKIKRIELFNIKKYDEVVIELSDGVNFISGKNGAGKTTIIESIGFALFDYKISRQNFDQYFIRKGEKKGQVRVFFVDKNGEEYIADRKISVSGAGNTWSIKKSDNTEEIAIVSKDEEVRAWLKDHLDFYIDDNISDIYTNIISVPQGEFSVAFLESERTRKGIFDPIFKLESYRRAYDNIQLEKGIAVNIRDLENDINIKLGETKKLDELEIEYQNLRNKDKIEKDLYTVIKKNFENLKIEYESLDKKKKTFEKLENDKKIAELQLEKLLGYIMQKERDINNSKKALNLIRENESKYTEYLKIEVDRKVCEEKFKEFLSAKEALMQIDKRIESGKSKIDEKEKFMNIQRLELLKKKDELIEQNTEIERLKQIVINKAEDVVKLENELKSMKVNVEYISESIMKMTHLKKDILKLLKSFEQPKKELNRIEDIKKAAKGIEDDESVNENILANVNIIKTKANELISSKFDESKSSDEEIKKITNEIESLRQSIILRMQSISLDVIDEDEMFRIYKQKYEEMSKIYTDASMEAGKQKTEIDQRQKQLDKEKVEYQAKQSKIKEEEEEKNKWLQALEKLGSDKEKMTADIQKYKDIEIKKLEMDNKISQLKPAYELYIINKVEAGKYDTLVSEHKAFVTDKAEKDEVLRKIVTELEEVAKTFDKDKYETEKYKYEIAKQEIIKKEEQLKTLEQQNAKYNKEVEYLKGVKKTIKEDEVKIKKMQKINEVIRKIRNIIKSAPDHISEILIKRISNKASEIYSKIAIDSSKLEWEKNYELVLYDILGGTEIRKEFKQLSGGEQITAALAIRLAMLELMTKIGIGILDEPTINMDASRRERLAEVIESVGSNFRQLIIVSHDDTFQSVTENVVELG